MKSRARPGVPSRGCWGGRFVCNRCYRREQVGETSQVPRTKTGLDGVERDIRGDRNLSPDAVPRIVKSSSETRYVTPMCYSYGYVYR